MPRILTRAAASEKAPVTVQSSVTHDGVTFHFDRPMFCGQFVTGEPFVVGTSNFQIISVTPESEDLAADGSVGNGTMKNPFTPADHRNDYTYAGSVTSEQGFDDYLATATNSGLSVSNTPYSAAANVDPGATGAPIVVNEGEECTFVKSVRSASATKAGDWSTIEKYVPLTVLSASPPVNSFMPSPSATTKTIYTAADVDLSVFRSITLPATFSQTLAEIEADIPPDSGNYGSNGEKLRRFRLDVNLGTTSANYSAQISDIYARACLVMHSDAYTASEKQSLLYKLIEWGIQLDGLYSRGWRGLGQWGDGAGQHGAFIDIYYLTAFALQDASMLVRAAATASPFDNAKFITASDVNIVPGENSGNVAQPYIAENIGIPDQNPTQDIGSNWSSRYGPIAAFIQAWEGAAVAMLQNGPSGETGFQARNQGSFAPTNDKAAIWGVLDRLATLDPYPGTTYTPGQEWRDLWAMVQALDGYEPWTGVPEQLHNYPDAGYQGQDGDRITATTDGYSWDVSDHDYATETVTSVDFRYSLDGVQYVESIGAGATGSISGLLKGVTHHVGLRFVSASGAGPWSQNWPLTTGGGWADTDRNAFPTTGTPTATAPTFTTDPVIHYKRSPQWDEFSGNWLPTSGTLDADAVELACGLGYVDGEAEPTFAFQWKRDGVNISGATLQTYTRTVDDASATLTCEVTPSNSAGTGTAATTAGVTVPAITTLPAGILIDTNFRGRFAIDYADEIASIVSSGCDLVHAPVASPIGLGENFGSLFWDKTSANPQGYFDLAKAASASTTYDITAQIALDGASISDRGDVTFTVEEVGGSVLFTETILGADVVAADDFRLLVDVSGSFTTGSITDLRIKMIWANSTGGIAGMDMHLTRLLIQEAA